MEINLLDTVVLKKDLPNQGLKCDDIGAVVEWYEPDGLVEVEFVTGSGKTQALVTLKTTDVRRSSFNQSLAPNPQPLSPGPSPKAPSFFLNKFLTI